MGRRRRISTHALREEGDGGAGHAKGKPHLISTHALREEGDLREPEMAEKGFLFLPTPSARRATVFRTDGRRSRRYFYPRPPRGGRLEETESYYWVTHFYPRPPRGGRRRQRNILPSWTQFLPTPSARRATHYVRKRGTIKAAFLPTPSARRATVSGSKSHGAPQDFYPRPPRGGRLDTPLQAPVNIIFLPTPSARRATSNTTTNTRRHEISTHALREEGDSKCAGK